MSQFSTNYAHKEIQRAIHATPDQHAPAAIKMRQAFEAMKFKLAESGVSARATLLICAAGLTVGAAVASKAFDVKAEIAHETATRTTHSVSAQGPVDKEFDAGIKASLERINGFVKSANEALAYKPELAKVFRQERPLASLSSVDKALYHDLEKSMLRAKTHLTNVHAQIEQQTVLSVIDGKPKFLLADSLAERLEKTETLYQNVAQKIASPKQSFALPEPSL